MREILFRGKRTDNGEWVEGSAFIPTKGGATCIVEQDAPFHSFCYEVIPETVGQYTGLTDKNGTKIFEGDIVLLSIDDQYYRGRVYYSGQSCRFTVKTKLCGYWSTYPLNIKQQLEIIGNIHDNPELLKEAQG